MIPAIAHEFRLIPALKQGVPPPGLRGRTVKRLTSDLRKHVYPISLSVLVTAATRVNRNEAREYVTAFLFFRGLPIFMVLLMRSRSANPPYHDNQKMGHTLRALVNGIAVKSIASISEWKDRSGKPYHKRVPRRRISLRQLSVFLCNVLASKHHQGSCPLFYFKLANWMRTRGRLGYARMDPATLERLLKGNLKRLCRPMDVVLVPYIHATTTTHAKLSLTGPNVRRVLLDFMVVFDPSDEDMHSDSDGELSNYSGESDSFYDSSSD